MVMEEQESDMELVSESIPVPRVQEPTSNVIKQQRNKSSGSRKPRLRKKALHAAILKQMEFYFSDANLTKDRYLAGLIKEDSYVNLKVFTNFNKLSALTTDTNRIAKALQQSTILEVSEDGTKVRRLTPINKKENIDECTVYVQNLPLDANHDWIISTFSKYGPVVYVSIPRYKSNKKIKGFAFVEFDTPKDARECIKKFQEKGCVLPCYTSPNDVLSITTYDENDTTSCDKLENLKHTSKRKITAVKDNKSSKKQKLSENESENTDNNAPEIDEDDHNIKQILGKSDKIKHNKTNKRQKLENESENSDDNALETHEDDHNTKQILKKSGKIKNNKTSKQRKLSVNENENTDNNARKIDGDNNTKQILGKRSKTRDKSSKRQKLSENDNENTDNDVSEIEQVDNNTKQILEKRKYVTEKSFIIDESQSEIKIKKKRTTLDQSIEQNNENSNMQNQETPNKNTNCNKIAGSDKKKKRKLTIDDASITEDLNEKLKKVIKSHESTINSEENKEIIKKVIKSRESTINSEENKEIDEESVNENDDNVSEQNVVSQGKRYSATKNIDATSSNIEKIESDMKDDERKKKKNRKKRSKIQEDFICNTIGLQVMAKKDWKYLRNRYLELQRSRMKELKLHLKKTKWNYEKVGQNYDKSKNEKENGKTNEMEKSRITYSPGIIVKIEMDEPCADTQSFKVKFKDNNSIKYIDVTYGSCEAYIRCDTAETAKTFVESNYEGKRLTILKDDEEKSYWDKIERDRKEKFNSTKRYKKKFKQRGRDKLLKKAEKELGKCIKFDQD